MAGRGYECCATSHDMSETPEPFALQPPDAVTLRSEAAADEPFLRAVYASTREAELNLTGWDTATRQTFLDLQFKAMCQGYRSMFPGGEFSIILLAGAAVGRMVVNRDERMLHLVDLAVLPAFRNRGIGTTVIGRLIAEAAQSHRRVQLEVQKGGRPRGLYERLGFRKFEETELFEFWEWTPPGVATLVKPAG